ncbi:MAG: hypothetical protein R3B83_13665 [Nitrospirales bacterium]|nr:hypothetical protein [Nitrospirales bacterium]
MSVTKGQWDREAHRKRRSPFSEKGFRLAPPLSPEHLQRFRVAWLEEATPSMGVLGKRLLKKIVNHEEERVLDFAAFTAQSSVTLEQIHR